MSAAGLGRQARDARRWLFDAVFPLWSSAGFDEATGQFVEQLSLAGSPLAEVPRRTLVQARQIYLFTVAGRMGWTGPWREVAAAAADALLARGRNDQGDWIFAFDAAGRASDTRLDLYTQAFVIFGLAHAADALGRADLLAAAKGARERLDAAWRAPDGGFVEGELHPGVRRQNPHMHLLEAELALWEAGRDPADLALAGELVGLFKARLSAAFGVCEYFDPALVPLTDDRGRTREPGHGFEWAWLMGRWGDMGGGDESALAGRLYADSRRGVGPDGIVWDEVWADGTVKTASARLWPQCERLRAALAHLARTGAPDDAADACSAYEALAGFFAGVAPGLWRDRRAADGAWPPGPAPASSGYHIVGALEPLIGAFGRDEV